MVNEVRLIDANFTKATIQNYIANNEVTEAFVEIAGYICDMLDASETVDAVEVVHGRCNWCNGEYHTKIMATAIRYHSNGNMDGYEMKVNYCPNCGAKMDGGSNETD